MSDEAARFSGTRALCSANHPLTGTLLRTSVAVVEDRQGLGVPLLSVDDRPRVAQPLREA